jgi:curved DNA-binding protein CbpA
MTDYFALFQQPRRPWLDVEELETKYHELARETHPDARQDRETNFAEVNAGYRTLRDPKSRLQHLLALEGKSPAANSSKIPADLIELFMSIAAVGKERDNDKLATLRRRVEQLFYESLQQLRELDGNWKRSLVEEAEILYRRFSLLSRWQEHLATSQRGQE